MAGGLNDLEMRIAELSIIVSSLLFFVVYDECFIAGTLVMENDIPESPLLEKQSIRNSHQAVVFDHLFLLLQSISQKSIV